MSVQTRRVLVAALLAGLALLPALAAARAEGDFVVQLGWLHVRPQLDNAAPSNRLRPSPVYGLLGIEEQFRSQGVTLSADPVDTPGLAFKYFVRDHWALKLQLGVLPKAELSGQGVIKPTGPAGEALRIDLGEPQFAPLGRARQWSPVAMVEYHWRAPSAAWRPYLGIGVNYTWFTQVALGEAFEAAVNRRFGVPLAAATGQPTPTRTRADALSVWAPAFELGATVALSERWSATLFAAHIPLSTTAVITLDAANGARLGESRTEIDIDPVILGLLAGYRF